MSQKLLLEGGGGGHMDHPFDLRWVKTGKDLLKFFTRNTMQYAAKTNPNVKLDGINTSFKLVKSRDADGNIRSQFAVDRGSMKPIDLEGVTLSRIGERFPEGHGMRPAIEALLKTFNAALASGEINEELRILGMDEDSNLFFNTEYVKEKQDEMGNRKPINTVLYNEDFFAIHGLNMFIETVSPVRGTKGRKGVEVSLDNQKAQALQSLIEKTRKFSNDYNVYGPRDAEVEITDAVDFNNALEQPIPITLSPGNIISFTLREWLYNPQVVNPFDARVDLLNGKNVGALSKFIYTSLIPDSGNPVPLSELVQDSEEDRILAINGALFYHATRLLGREVLKATRVANIGSESGADHEGIVMRDGEIFGNFAANGKVKPVKITGDFIVAGLTGNISTLVKPEKGIPDTPEPKRIGLVPMAAKPFHKGHMALIKMAAEQNDQVNVYVSLSDRVKTGEFPVYGEQMQEIWKTHLLDLMPSNVNVELLPRGLQPVRLVYETLGAANDAQSSDIFTVYSDPVDTRQNYPEKYRSKYFGDLYTTGNVFFAAEENPQQFTRGAGTPDASGTMARKALGEDNFEVFANLMPNGADAQAIWSILMPKAAENEPEEQNTDAPPPVFMGESIINFIFETIEGRLDLIEQENELEPPDPPESVQNKIDLEDVKDEFLPDKADIEPVPGDMGTGVTFDITDDIEVGVGGKPGQFGGGIEFTFEGKEPYQREVAAKHVGNRLTTKGNTVKEPPYVKNPPVARSESAPPAGLVEGVKEGVWHHGSDGDIEGDLRALYLTPSKSLASMLGKKVYSFKIDPNANWLDVGTPEYDYISMDSLGYSQKQVQRLKQEGVDVVWNIDDFNKGFQQVYVINPEVLQKAKDDIKETSTVEEASSIAAGDVQGHSGNSSKKKQPSLIREEDDELVEETIDYLLKALRGED